MKRFYLSRSCVCVYLCLGVLFLSSYLQGQTPIDNIFDYRMFDGSFNDLRKPEEGKAGNEFIRIHDKSYYFGNGETMIDRGNVRRISNQMFNQHNNRPDPNHLSSMMFTFLQFLDHDITFTKQGTTEFAPISIPTGDPQFDPFATGSVTIPFMRVAISGNSQSQRQQINEVTSWIDASMVYGSDEGRANWLRSGICGKMKVSPSANGDLLPCNTITGNCEDALDANAPSMDHDRDRNGQPMRIFVAGDIRANEQPGLTALHTLFVREHNRICDQLVIKYGCNDDENYHRARKIVGGLIQSIVYNEVLPILGIDLGNDDYAPEASGDIHNSFATAAYRLGHTMITESIPLLYKDCNQGEAIFELLPLRDAFFNPNLILNKGIHPILSGLSAQTQEAIDPKVVQSARSFLFGAPGSGGLDLVALNIQRGRDHGLPDYNSLRSMFGLSLVRNFNQINPNSQIAATLEDVYESVNNIDAWVGMLSEPPLPNKAVGETIHALLSHQFNNLRKADRFYYTRDPLINPIERQDLTTTKLADIINRNSGHNPLKNVFINEAQCLPTGTVRKENEIICNEVLITYEDSGQLSIQGTHGIDYAYELARDPMGLALYHQCPTSCGDSYDTTLPIGTYYVTVKNKRNRTVCEARINIKPSFANTKLVAETPAITNNTLSVFPNPANSILNIKVPFPANELSNLYVVNMLGQIVHTLSTTASHYQISVGHLPKGVYEIVAQSPTSGILMQQKVSIQ